MSATDQLHQAEEESFSATEKLWRQNFLLQKCLPQKNPWAIQFQQAIAENSATDKYWGIIFVNRKFVTLFSHTAHVSQKFLRTKFFCRPRWQVDALFPALCYRNKSNAHRALKLVLLDSSSILGINLTRNPLKPISKLYEHCICSYGP